MAYTAVYTGTDLGNIFIDLFGTIVNALTQNAATITIILIVALIALFGGRAINAIFGVFKSFR